MKEKYIQTTKKQHFQLQASNKFGRNQPCPCGSGRKFKQCHLPKIEADRKRQEEIRRTVHEFTQKSSESPEAEEKVPQENDQELRGQDGSGERD